ncbi:MAG: hypothetical protein AAFX79_04840 [Planctomycetota bacterium]
MRHLPGSLATGRVVEVVIHVAAGLVSHDMNPLDDHEAANIGQLVLIACGLALVAAVVLKVVGVY